MKLGSKKYTYFFVDEPLLKWSTRPPYTPFTRGKLLSIRLFGRATEWLMPRVAGWLVGSLVIGLLILSPRTTAGTPEPEYLTVRNGLPQGFISSIVQDQKGFIWLATRDGLCRYDGIHFRIYTHVPLRASSLSFSSIYQIKVARTGALWIRTENNHIDRFDPVTEQSSRLSNTPAFRQALGQDQLISIQPDGAGNVWVATRLNGFFRLNANGTIAHRHWALQRDTVQNVLHSLIMDRNSRVWLATRNGLYRYDPATKQLTPFRTEQGLPQREVYQLHERKNGELMLGFPGNFALFDPLSGRVRKTVELLNEPGLPLFATDARGIDYVNQNRYTDKNGLVPLLGGPSAQSPKLARYSTISLLVDRTNVLWLGLNGDGVIKYDLNKRPFQTWAHTSNFQTDWLTQQLNIPKEAIPAGIRQQAPASIRYQFDGRGVLWISSGQTVPYQYDASRQLFFPVPPTGIEPRWLRRNSFRFTAMATGAQGELWGLLGPDNKAVARYNPDQKNFTAFPLPISATHPYVITAMVVDGGRVYLSTDNQGLLRADLSKNRLIHWNSIPGDPKSLPGNSLLCLAQDPARYNYLWIGTFGEGLCRLDKITGRIQRFPVGQGLSSHVIYAIRTDKSGHLWLSTNRGLARFDTRTYEVRSYTSDDGLPSEEFRQFHDVTLPNGRLIFGGIGGYTVFDPARIREDPVRTAVALTALRINNQLVTPTTPDSPLQKVINETDEVVLSNGQNFLSIDFAALEYNQSYKNQYRYKLAGLDKDWVYSGNVATATYTNLPPNHYTFIVNASNTSGAWSPTSHSLSIVIEPPLWATWWACLGYALLLMGALILFLRIRIRRMHQQGQMKLREQESMQLKHLDEVKSRFFANITHELRTPLTLILTPLEQVIQDSANSPYHNRLSLIYQNAGRLLRLINELLDLAKLDAGNLTINPTPADLPDFIQRTVSSFVEEAGRKRIQIQLTNTFSHPYYWFDPDKVEKVVSNLLSNALKFTQEDGSIRISVRATPMDSVLATPMNSDLIRLVVQNSGSTIPDQKLSRIFDRFYQIDPQAEGAIGGSGIGLALVKELVEMMQGTVLVDSQPVQGTTFTIELPCRRARTDLVAGAVPTEPEPAVSTTDTFADYPETTDEKLYRILLVEDNDELAEYILSTLKTEGRVKRVSNGRLGVSAALADGPDIIVSDVIMPEMDGYELCRQLKGNPVTSHIPIILLTAKASVDSRLEGLMAGADDYLAKPFQVDELRGRVRNRLELQLRTRQHLRTQLLGAGNLPTTSKNPQDEFMNRIYGVLEERLDDTTFGVEPLAMAMGMSRMQLNRKVKGMTGLTPIELIRIIRLRKAAELLLAGVSVSETADRVGFDTAAYFSKVFKEQYHFTPSEYVDQHRDEVTKNQ